MTRPVIPVSPGPDRPVTTTAEIPTPAYDVIYADPPWRFKRMFASATYSNDQENHYPTMSLDDICGLSVPARKDAVLYLWVTSPHLEQGFRVINAWGFTYKASAAWVKPSPGTGYWWRNQHEILLAATRGKWPAPKPKERVPSVYALPRGRHSEKPAEVREQIAAWWPDADRLEMFARKPQPGWAVWGNEVHDIDTCTDMRCDVCLRFVTTQDEEAS